MRSAFLAALTATCCLHTLSPEQNAFLASWLKRHPTLALATEADSRCPGDIAEMKKDQGGRWKAVPDFHPYQVVADLNGDGQTDIAVVLKGKKIGQIDFRLAVFNGPLKANGEPVFQEPLQDMSCAGMFFGPPRPKPYRLVVGPFESEGSVLVPSGASYKWDNTTDDY